MDDARWSVTGPELAAYDERATLTARTVNLAAEQALLGSRLVPQAHANR